MKKIYYWTTKDGKKINVDDLTTDHMRNIIKMLLKKSEEGKENLNDLYWEYLAEDYGCRD